MRYIQSSDRESQLKVTEHKGSFKGVGYKSAGINIRKVYYKDHLINVTGMDRGEHDGLLSF